MTDLTDTGTSLREASDTEIYRRLAPELIRFATALVGPADAPDVLSTAFMKAIAAPGWPMVDNHRAYLYRAVLNVAHTHRRRRFQRRDLEARTASGPHWDLPNLHPHVRDAVLRLSVRQRAVIVLTYWSDLDPPTVATHLGISEGAVRRHLARARARLREALDA